MKTQIARYLGTFAVAAALLTSTTAAFAATPASVNPALYDDDATQEGDFTAGGLVDGGAALGVASEIVGAAAGGTESGVVTSESLGVGSAVLTDVAAPIVQIATR
jgi:hypothetical protein